MKSKIAFQPLKNHQRNLLLAALYFDEVHLTSSWINIQNNTGITEPEPNVIHEEYGTGDHGVDFTVRTLPSEIRKNVGILEEEGILKIRNDTDHRIGYNTAIKEKVIEIATSIYDSESKDSSFNEDLNHVFNSKSGIWKPRKKHAKPQNDYEFGLIVGFLAYLGMENASNQGIPFYTDSQIVQRIAREFFQKQIETEIQLGIASQEVKKSKLAMDILDFSLPNIDNYNVDDVLEVRLKLKDQLEPFRNHIAKLSWEVEKETWEPDFSLHVKKVTETSIIPLLADLQNKIKASNEKVISKIFRKIHDPKTYVPAIGSLFAGIQPEIALGLGLSLASAEVIYERIIEEKNTKRLNQLTFLFDSSKMLS